MIYLIFKSGVIVGNSTVPYTSDDTQEVIHAINVTELINLAGEDWEENTNHLSLTDGVLIYN